MIRRLLVAFACVTLLVPVVASAAEELKPRGRPSVLARRGPMVPPRLPNHGYYLWVDKDGWHLRTTSKDAAHRFAGEITVEGGTFTDLKNANADSRRRKQGGDGDSGVISKDKLKITFGMRTNADMDGFDFKVSDDATKLKLDLKIDNDPANQKRIFIGAKSQNPENNIFEVPVVKVTED